jgi:hypothetical protein
MKYRHMCVIGWFMASSLLWIVNSRADENMSADSEILRVHNSVDFHGEAASHATTQLANWVLQTDDHQGLPFAVVDKINAHVFVFNPLGDLLGSAPVLLGLTRGDDGLVGLGDRPLSLISPKERTTPSGRFLAALAKNQLGQEILWVDYDQGISMHPVRSVDPKERRLERLASPTVQDNRISYGCINVPEKFWHHVLVPALRDTQAFVYVLPETRPLKSVFSM